MKKAQNNSRVEISDSDDDDVYLIRTKTSTGSYEFKPVRPESSESIRRISGPSESIRRIPGPSESIRRIPESSESIRRISGPSESIRRIPESSESIRPIPKFASKDASGSSSDGISEFFHRLLDKPSSSLNDCKTQSPSSQEEKDGCCIS